MTAIKFKLMIVMIQRQKQNAVKHVSTCKILETQVSVYNIKLENSSWDMTRRELFRTGKLQALIRAVWLGTSMLVQALIEARRSLRQRRVTLYPPGVLWRGSVCVFLRDQVNLISFCVLCLTTFTATVLIFGTCVIAGHLKCSYLYLNFIFISRSSGFIYGNHTLYIVTS